MYSQVQIPVPIHVNTIGFAVIVNFFHQYFSLITLKKLLISWLILHKPQNWYLYNVTDRFRYHQNMLVLARYRYRHQNRCSSNYTNIEILMGATGADGGASAPVWPYKTFLMTGNTVHGWQWSMENSHAALVQLNKARQN